MTAPHDDAGLRIHELSEIDDLRALAALFADVWQVSDGSQILDPDAMRALSFSGNYVAGAYLDGALTGGAVGFASPDGSLHSHLTAVVASARSRGVGFGLKLHQREWALKHRIESIQWTFDPMRIRNARFNIQRLGAIGVDYIPDFYGTMDDGLNAGRGPSDRMLADWLIGTPRVETALSRGLPEPHVGIRVRVGSRSQLRQCLTEAFQAGRRVVGVTGDGCYVLGESG
ncbi:MAG: GNAT family N-acetyltransferase [Stackebrandtia sp.]